MTNFIQRRSHATLVAIDRNGWSPCVGTRGHHRRYAHAAADARRMLDSPASTASAPCYLCQYATGDPMSRRWYGYLATGNSENGIVGFIPSTVEKELYRA